jgi:Spy/CpxP family protein refolding chaperone
MITKKRMGLGVGAGLLALGVAAGVYASAQNTNPDPRPFSGRGLGLRGPMGPGGPGGRGGPMGPGGPLGMLRMLGPRLGLTDAQKDQVKSVAESHREEWKALADRTLTAHQALHDAVTAETVDEALIRQRSADVAAVEADLAVAQARAHAEVWQILTPEQRSQAAAFQAQAKERRKARP